MFSKIVPVKIEEVCEIYVIFEVISFLFKSFIFKSLINNITKSEKQGGSTITQQYIKNTYLSNDKTISRKLKELYYSIKLEQITTKKDILTKYLNCIYFGNNIYGLANASTYAKNPRGLL